MAGIKGKWDFNWTVFKERGWPENLETFINCPLPDWIGAGSVDDISANINEERNLVDNYLKLIPFGYNYQDLNTTIEDGDIMVCMEVKPHIPKHERFLEQRGWHSEVCYKTDEGNARVAGVNWGKITDADGNDYGYADYTNRISNVYRFNFPTSSFDPATIKKLKQQVKLWAKIYDNITPPDNRGLDPLDFNNQTELMNIASRLIKRPSQKIIDLPPVTCIQWAYTVVCLSMSSFLSRKNLIDNGMFEDFKKNWSELLSEIPDDLQGIKELPFEPYTHAKAIQAALDTYVKGMSLNVFLSDSKIKELLINYMSVGYNRATVSNYFQKVVDTGNIDDPLVVDGRPIYLISPSLLYCEAKRAYLKKSNMPWIGYVGTMIDERLVREK